MKSIFAITAVLFGLSSSAYASGGYLCVIDDANLKFEMGGGLSHSIPGGPWNESGSLELRDAALNKVFGMAQIKESHQFWQEGDDLNLLVYNEPTNTTKYSSLKLVIHTKYAGDFSHQGQYTLELVDGGNVKTLSGSVTCGLD
jgi:hypothetical protein